MILDVGPFGFAAWLAHQRVALSHADKQFVVLLTF